MSEYQYVAFRAIETPVSEKDLEYMHRQSSRAEITPWSFENEYHYGDFRGNAVEMLRRGYDIHLHYANFGTRTLLIRFPHGLPNPRAAKPYVAGDSLRFLKDKQGPGGILKIEPYFETDDLEDFWELGGLIDRLAPLRDEILAGDLRPLYLAHLAVSSDGDHDPEETVEAPVPAGLSKLTAAQTALAGLYQLSDALIAAASQGSPPMPTKQGAEVDFGQWLAKQPAAKKDAWLAQWMADTNSSVRGEMLSEFRKSQDIPPWPTVRLNRTIAQLEKAAENVAEQARQKAAAKAARQRAKKLADMAADPSPYLKETERLVAMRSTDAYRKVANQLVDLREALAGTKNAGLAERQAQKLKKANPTLRLLTSELRRQGFVPK